MRKHSGILAILALLLSGCASLTLVNPADQSTVSMPQQITVTTSGFVEFGDVYLDNVDITRINGSSWVGSSSTLYYVAPGPHQLFLAATDGKWGTNIGQTANFKVSTCPLCYVCPAPSTVHPTLGQCCSSATTCDNFGVANFGPRFYQNQKCQQALAPGSTQFWSDFDCISTDLSHISGSGASGGPQMIAVSFSVPTAGALSQIQAPIGLASGTNEVQVWITTDAGGKPGTALESLTVLPIRQQPGNGTVNAPFHIFSNTHPALSTGTLYWLVIGPGGANTVVDWNLSQTGDVSTPGVTTYLLNPTSLTGTWAKKSNLQEVRPAFEIDVR